MGFHQREISRPHVVDGEEELHAGRPWRLYYFYGVLKLLVFDLDGTLADTRLDLAASVNHALIASGRRALPVEQVVAQVGNGAERLIANCLATASASPSSVPDPDDVKKVLGLFLDHYKDHCLGDTVLYPGVAAALDALRGRAERSMAVLTNKPMAPTLKILDGLGLAGYFDRVVGGDTPYGRKPEAEGLKHIMAALKAGPAETALIGDGVQDAGAARKAGTFLIGFLGGIAPREAMLAQRPDAAFESMDRLPAAVADLEARATTITSARAAGGGA